MNKVQLMLYEKWGQMILRIKVPISQNCINVLVKFTASQNQLSTLYPATNNNLRVCKIYIFFVYI